MPILLVHVTQLDKDALLQLEGGAKCVYASYRGCTLHLCGIIASKFMSSEVTILINTVNNIKLLSMQNICVAHMIIDLRSDAHLPN